MECDTGKPCCPDEYVRLGLEGNPAVSWPSVVSPSPTSDPRDFVNPALKPSIERSKVTFGRPDSASTSIKEGSLCSRNEMFRAQLHNSDQRGVSGNIELGADAVVMARNDALVRERDGFTWLR